MAILAWENILYYRKIYNEDITDKLQFLELIKSQICKSYKGITRKQSDLTVKKLKKKKRQEWVD